MVGPVERPAVLMEDGLHPRAPIAWGFWLGASQGPAQNQASILPRSPAACSDGLTFARTAVLGPLLSGHGKSRFEIVSKIILQRPWLFLKRNEYLAGPCPATTA